MTSKYDDMFFPHPTIHNLIRLFEFQWYIRGEMSRRKRNGAFTVQNTFESVDFCRKMRVKKSWTYVFRWCYIWIYCHPVYCASVLVSRGECFVLDLWTGSFKSIQSTGRNMLRAHTHTNTMRFKKCVTICKSRLIQT